MLVAEVGGIEVVLVGEEAVRIGGEERVAVIVVAFVVVKCWIVVDPVVVETVVAGVGGERVAVGEETVGAVVGVGIAAIVASVEIGGRPGGEETEVVIGVYGVEWSVGVGSVTGGCEAPSEEAFLRFVAFDEEVVGAYVGIGRGIAGTPAGHIGVGSAVASRQSFWSGIYEHCERLPLPLLPLPPPSSPFPLPPPPQAGSTQSKWALGSNIFLPLFPPPFSFLGGGGEEGEYLLPLVEGVGW